jgi:hypothetical protein
VLLTVWKQRPAINAIAEPQQPFLAHKLAQGAQHLILAAQIAELARQEHGTPPARDPRLNLVAQCHSISHV